MNTLTSAGHVLHHEMKKAAKEMHETIHMVNRPYDRPWYVHVALDELRRITDRQAEARVRELRRSILGTEHVGGALCGDVIRVRPPATWPRAASTKPQEAP